VFKILQDLFGKWFFSAPKWFFSAPKWFFQTAKKDSV